MAMMASGPGNSHNDLRDDESILGDDLIEADDGAPGFEYFLLLPFFFSSSLT